MTGPGHGGPGLVANTYLEGTYSEVYPEVSQDADGMRRLFRQFSFPGGIPSHVAPETPGSIHEGGELGYALAHAFGAAFDNPDLLVVLRRRRRRGRDGAARDELALEQVPEPGGDGAVLPILHLNGYKIANPTVLARIPEEELEACSAATATDPMIVDGDEPAAVHQALAAALDACSTTSPRSSGAHARTARRAARVADDHPPHAQGLDGSRGGRRATGRGHVALAPGADDRAARERRTTGALLEEWMRSYRPGGALRRDGRLCPSSPALRPEGERA